MGRSLACVNGATISLTVQVWIVNNSPEDQSLLSLTNAEEITVHLIQAPGNIGFGRACNLAISKLWEGEQKPWIWLLNPDVTVDKQVLKNFVGVAANKNDDWAIAGTRVKTATGETEFNGGHWNRKTGEIYPLNKLKPIKNYQPTSWVSGCSLILNPRKFDPIKPHFDPDFFLYYEDFEFCHRNGKLLRSPQTPHPIVLLSRLTDTHHTSSMTGHTPEKKIAWAIEGYLLALEKCAPWWVWWGRLGRIAIAASWGRIHGRSGKWIGLKHYLYRRIRQRRK